MRTYQLWSWPSGSWEETVSQVTGVAEVVAAADRIADTYRASGINYLPGLALWRGVDLPENSLCICVAADGWAIVHTDDDLWQTVTHGPYSSEHSEYSERFGRTLRKVCFGEFLEIPGRCFLDKDLAVETVSYWMESGELLERAGFSGADVG